MQHLLTTQVIVIISAFCVLLVTTLGILINARNSESLDPAMKADAEDILGGIENMENEEDVKHMSYKIDDFDHKYQSYIGAASYLITMFENFQAMRDIIMGGLSEVVSYKKIK